MRWAEGFIAVDWGTTNRRAYRIAPDGTMTDEMEDGQGILSVGPEGFPAAVAQLRARMGDLPLLMGGMIGSNHGWAEARYAPAPASLADLAGRLVWPEPGFAAIIPGVSYQSAGRADVMRGEETQILGAVASGMIPADCFVCHPGTHSKWVRVEERRISSFRTVMTGEMFNLLREHSILADLLSGSAGEGEAFEQGVRRGLEHDDLTAEMFSVRARVLLGEARAEDAGSYISGLLIGIDIRTGLRDALEGRIVVMGRPELTHLFASALALAGRETVEIDGEQAFLLGARQIAEQIG